jgi:hypothetical protein
VYTVLDDIVVWLTGKKTVKAEVMAVANPGNPSQGQRDK